MLKLAVAFQFTTVFLHSLLVNIPRGGTTNVLFEYLYKMCRYDLIPYMDEIYDTYLGFPPHKALNNRME
jgi:hypothetical protein